MVEPTTYELILAQLVRIEGKLDELPRVFMQRVEYEKRHESLIVAIGRAEKIAADNAEALESRVTTVEENFTKMIWAFGGTVAVTLIGLVIFLIQGHIVF